jgi:hypothetical protein
MATPITYLVSLKDVQMLGEVLADLEGKAGFAALSAQVRAAILQAVAIQYLRTRGNT